MLHFWINNVPEFMGSWYGRSSLGQPVVEAGIDDESATEVVVSAVAIVANAELTDLPPLYETVDPESLNELFPPDTDVGAIRFDYDDYVVVVRADEVVEVYEPTGA